jgi:Bacterial lipid A biosynthesis acyltransferase
MTGGGTTGLCPRRVSAMASLATIIFPTLRLAERVLPPRLLRLLLSPAVLFGVFARLRLQRRWLARYPPALRPHWWNFFVVEPLRSGTARFLTFWPDRLAGPRWRSRCEVTGPPDALAAAKAHRPVVLVSLHVGPCVLLPYWLRSLGVPVATMSASRDGRSVWRERRYRLTPQPEIPVVFGVEEVRAAIDFLGAGHTLLLLIDVPRGRQHRVPFEDRTLSLATSALRMAARCDALVVPCLIAEKSPWQFAIHTSAALPPQLSESEAMLHLIHEWTPILRKFPEQWEADFLLSLTTARDA